MHSTKLSFAIVFAVAAWNLCAFEAAAVDDLWPENAVLIRAIITAPDGAQLRAGERVIGKTKGLLVDVKKVQGDWLWIHSAEGLQGWIRKSEATPLDNGYQYFSARIRRNPRHAEAFHRRAAVLNATAFRSSNSAAQLDQALRDAERALRLAPREPAYYEGRGNIWLSKDNPDRALADYEQAIRLSPDDAFYYAGAARAWLNKKDADQALSIAAEGIRRDPRLPSLYRVRRDAYKEKKDYLNAYFDYRRARKLDQGSQGGAFGLIDMSEGELLLSSAAEADLAAFQPRDFEEFADLAQAWRNKGKYARAIADFDIAVREKDSDGRLRLGRGECRDRVGQYAEALTDYEAAMRLDPEEWFAFTDAALLLASCPDAAIRNGPRAIELALKACDLCGGIDSEALAALAAAYAETGDFEKAVATQREALDAAFQNEKAAYQQRLELYQSGKPYRESPPGTESSASSPSTASSQPPPESPSSTSALADTQPTAIQAAAETQPAASQPPPAQVDSSHPQTTGPLEAIQQQEPSFYVRASCDHASGVYYESETLGLRVQCEIDAYVYVVYRQADGKTYQIFPNSVQSDNCVKAGVETPIPASDDLFRWEVAVRQGNGQGHRVSKTAREPGRRRPAEVDFQSRFRRAGERSGPGVEPAGADSMGRATTRNHDRCSTANALRAQAAAIRRLLRRRGVPVQRGNQSRSGRRHESELPGGRREADGQPVSESRPHGRRASQSQSKCDAPTSSMPSRDGCRQFRSRAIPSLSTSPATAPKFPTTTATKPTASTKCCCRTM